VLWHIAKRPGADDARPTNQNRRNATRAADPQMAVLALLGVAQLIVVLDVTIVNVALTSPQRALGFLTEGCNELRLIPTRPVTHRIGAHASI
jgi:hypothetical protein